jgi:PadR family transcriptional regulator PadR
VVEVGWMDVRDPKSETELRRGVLQLVALALLEEPRYGYELVRMLGEVGFDTEEGTLYPILRRFEEQGALESTWDTSRARPRKYYRLSDDGRRVRKELSDAWRKVRDATDAALKGTS